MIKNVLIAAILAFGFAATSLAAVIYVQVGPPAAIYETVPALPGQGYIWFPGYYTWTGGRYVWVHGRYVRHAGAWCAGHWRHVEHQVSYWIPDHWC
jgi:hypothetical protein